MLDYTIDGRLWKHLILDILHFYHITVVGYIKGKLNTINTDKNSEGFPTYSHIFNEKSFQIEANKHSIVQSEK